MRMDYISLVLTITQKENDVFLVRKVNKLKFYIIRIRVQSPLSHKKTVSFSRLPNEAPIKNAADCVTLMQGGHQFVKMRSNARIYNRFYWFDVAAQ